MNPLMKPCIYPSPLDRDEPLHGDCERGVDRGRDRDVGQGQQHREEGRQNQKYLVEQTYSVFIPYLQSIELAVEVDGEHEDAEDDADGVEDEEL